MRKRKFAIVSTEDELMFLSKNNKHNNNCSACGELYDIGGTIMCDAVSKRIRYCKNCLLKMQAVLSEGKLKDFSKWNFSVKKYIGSKASSFSPNKKAEFIFFLSNEKIYLTSEELDMVYHQTSYFNEKYNDSFIHYREKIKNRKNQKLLKNAKRKYYNDALNAIKYIDDPVLAQRYFMLSDKHKPAYLKKITEEKTLPSSEDCIKTDKRMFDDTISATTHNIGSKNRHLKNSTKLKITENISPCNCDSINHINTAEAKYYISTNNKNIPFALTACPTCLLSLKSAIENSFSNTFYENGEIHITKTIFHDNNHCLFCTENSGINNRIHIKNIEFNCCEKHKAELLEIISSALKQKTSLV